jgi:hypothetical protein
MFLTKKMIILFFNLFLLSLSGYCQLMYDSSAGVIIISQNNGGYDSIDKRYIKHKQSAEFISGEADAKEYYTDNKVFAITFITSLLVPPAGFITTLALSSSNPKVRNLNVPNEKLLINDQYANGYMHKAKRMKAGRAWAGCLTGLTFFGIAFLMVYDIK